MSLDAITEGETTDRSVDDHLERALEASDEAEKNFHVRQAMQLLLAEDDR